MKIGITGIRGKMAKALAFEVISNNLFDISGALVREGYDEVGQDIGDFLGLDKTNSLITDNLEKLFDDADAVIDFSSPELTMRCAEVCARKGKILISGTTGLTNDEKEKLGQLTQNCIIVYSENMSIGANLLLNLVEESASLLRNDYDTEILEMHNRNKKDAPSETALMLGQAIAKGKNFSEISKKVRDGIVNKREVNEIGFAVLRCGDVVSEHTVIFAGMGERIELSHKATSKLIFVHGAIRAAIWAFEKENGFYNMQDILRIKR
ncbi:MAG TPA: 4-hydroxy-tetrahydrodipicolinate reductase [Rickettsiales bacterium]|nr:4-hydroxy-tetrahydrodipicolinate reductase [Rickettsiales bacterium]